MEISDIAFLNGTAQSVRVRGEACPVPLDDIAGAAHGSGSVIPVLGHLVPGACHDKTRAGGYIESVLPVTSCPDYVHRAVGAQVHTHTCFHKRLTET